METFIQSLLDNMPDDWRGTTFKNSELLGREQFSHNLLGLFDRQTPLTTEELLALGNAEDYLRVATNISTTLECVLARRKNLSWGVNRVWTFASTNMPFIAVGLISGGRTVRLFYGHMPAPLTPAQCGLLGLIGANVQCHAGPPPPVSDVSEVVLVLEGVEGTDRVHGIVSDSVLYIVDTATIDPEEILVIRKRMATPMTTPAVEAELERLAGRVPAADSDRAEPEAVKEFCAHLQHMCGTKPDASTPPQLFTAGLSALASLWLALVARGGVDVLMCSTAYGGCSQCTDLIAERTDRFCKSTFDIQGDASIDESIQGALSALVTAHDLPLTVLFVEIPTNPDQKVPDTQKLVDSLQTYKQQTRKDVLLIVDTTFAPASQILSQIERLAPDLPAMVFMSMSKSVSRGRTTAGALIANHTPQAAAILRQVKNVGGILDTTARPDQIVALVRNHKGVEERCRAAYNVTVEVGERLCAAVKGATGEEMPLAYISPQQAEAGGFTSSTFSFNLPAPAGASSEENAGLAQRYVDFLTVDEGEPGSLFKACVSFGQDNGLVYCTVPATSTQGVIAEEDKAKQARDGVQLVRLSFPPTIDVDAVCERMESAVEAVYAGQQVLHEAQAEVAARL